MSTPRQQYIAVNWHRCKYEANSCLLLTLAADHVLRKVADTSDRAVPHAKEGVIRACRLQFRQFCQTACRDNWLHPPRRSPQSRCMAVCPLDFQPRDRECVA